MSEDEDYDPMAEGGEESEGEVESEGEEGAGAAVDPGQKAAAEDAMRGFDANAPLPDDPLCQVSANASEAALK